MSWRWLVGALLCCGAWSCASGTACKKDPITGSDRCEPASGNYGEAAATAVAAGTSWAAVGCKVNGCEPPFHCNEDTKLCERIRCGEGQGKCPPAYVCDPEERVCR